MTRVSKGAATALLVLSLSFSAPSAFAAAQRGPGGDPDWGTRIVRIVKSLIHHFILVGQTDSPVPPIPSTTP